MPTATNAGPTGGAIVPGVESLDVSIEWDDGTWPYNPFIDLSSIAIAYVFCFAPVVTGLIGSNRLKTPFLTLGGTSRTLVNVRSMFLLGESSPSRFFFFFHFCSVGCRLGISKIHPIFLHPQRRSIVPRLALPSMPASKQVPSTLVRRWCGQSRRSDSVLGVARRPTRQECHRRHGC